MAYRTDFSITEVVEFVKNSENQPYVEEVAKALNISVRTLIRRCGQSEYGSYRNLVKEVKGKFERKVVQTKQEYTKSNYRNLVCKQCGKQFVGHYNKEFCTDECKKEYKKLQRKPKVCPTCGKEFFAHGRTKFCSDKCAEIRDTCVICGREYVKSHKDRSIRRDAPTCSRQCSNIYFLSKSGKQITVEDIERAVAEFDGQPTAEQIAKILNSTYVKVVLLSGEKYGSYPELVKEIKGEYIRESVYSRLASKGMYEEATTRLMECLYCGKEFESHFNGRYCSSRCKERAKREKIVDVRCCIKCRKDFDVQYKFRHDLMCPKCKPPISKEAATLFDLLDEMGFQGEREKTLDGLVNPKTGHHLRLDYFIESIPLAVEYNGRQHYMEIPLYHKDEEGFIESRYRDEVKRNFLRENGIPLIIWRYDEPVTKEKVIEKFGRFI